MGNVWDDVLPEQDRLVFERAGWGKRVGFGERPALLVVDVIYNFVGDRPEPILDSIERWRYSCGERGWAGVAQLRRLIAAARAKQVPIFYTGMNRRPDGFDQGAWNWKSHRAGEPTDVQGHRGNEIVAEVAPEPQDVYFVKDKPSAFHGTHLLDIQMKYGDVRTTDDTIAWLASLPQRPCGPRTPTGAAVDSDPAVSS